MLIETLSPILVDKKEAMQYFRLNATSNNQMRLKTTRLVDGEHKPVDVVIYSYNVSTSMKDLSININASGREMITNKNFSFKISRGINDSEWSATGTVDSSSTRFKFNEPLELIIKLLEML